jgi:hypothetical protein
MNQSLPQILWRTVCVIWINILCKQQTIKICRMLYFVYLCTQYLAGYLTSQLIVVQKPKQLNVTTYSGSETKAAADRPILLSSVIRNYLAVFSKQLEHI